MELQIANNGVLIAKEAGLLGKINFIQKKIKVVKISITADHGELAKQDYEDKINEALRQMNLKKE